jgi:hypothetical protein
MSGSWFLSSHAESIAVLTLACRMIAGGLAIAPTATATFSGISDQARNCGVVFFACGSGAIPGGLISGKARELSSGAAPGTCFHPIPHENGLRLIRTGLTQTRLNDKTTLLFNDMSGL